jgi:predicted lipoprotein with Yx(FWY)xxD motif
MKFPRWALPAAALAVSGMLLTGCGGEGGSAKQNVAAGSRATSKPTADASTDPSADPSAGAANEVDVEVANDPDLGRIVVDDEGNTLYRFDKDTTNPPASNCYEECAEKWPPVTTTSAKPVVQGVDAKLVGTITRKDGTKQVTLGDWPLYRYAQDRAPGDTAGHRVQGTWYVSDPTGKKAGAQNAQNNAPRENGNADEGNNDGRWAGKVVLRVVTDPQMGEIVVDAKGRTLYVFDKDRRNRSNCSGDCAKAWPPVKGPSKLTADNLVVEGIDRDRVGNIERPDGVCQITLNGQPLYLFAKDTKPGDTKGQGVQDVWWVVDENGQKIEDAQDGGNGNDNGYGGGY